jgi:hypothetical protein
MEASARVQRRHHWGIIVHRCSKKSMLWWMCQLLLWRAHPWPHRGGASSEIVGGPHWGAPAIVVGAAGVIVLAFPLPLPLPLILAFAAIVEGGGRRGRGYRRTWWFLLWWMRRQELLRSMPSSLGNGVECRGMPLGHRVVPRRMVWKEGNDCDHLMKIFM